MSHVAMLLVRRPPSAEWRGEERRDVRDRDKERSVSREPENSGQRFVLLLLLLLVVRAPFRLKVNTERFVAWRGAPRRLPLVRVHRRARDCDCCTRPAAVRVGALLLLAVAVAMAGAARWRRRCLAKWSERAKHRPHSSHAKLRSPVCCRRWRASSSERANERSQPSNVHRYGFSPAMAMRSHSIIMIGYDRIRTIQSTTNYTKCQSLVNESMVNVFVLLI